MSWPILTPLLISVLTPVLGIIIYTAQKRIDRRIDLTRSRQEIYRNYLAAQQRVLLAVRRIDDSSRRAAIDDFNSAEALLYVLAPREVAKLLASTHAAFEGYTNAYRARYERGFTASPHRGSDLATAADLFVKEFKTIIMAMRTDTLSPKGDEGIDVFISALHHPR